MGQQAPKYSCRGQRSNAGVGSRDRATEQWALRINLLAGLVNILATIPAIALIDRAGRKPLLPVGSAGMTVTLGIMAPFVWGLVRETRVKTLEQM